MAITCRQRFFPTCYGVEHIIVKLLKSNRDADRLILENEAPYLEVARMFGLNVKAPLRYRNGVLSIPRFDREPRGESLHLHGQESLVSAKGVSEFAHVTSHEEYLAIIQKVSDDPVRDTLEYVLRDILNLAMGNPDNHGRNSALSKLSDGGIRLSPLFDFPPMRLSEAGVARSTRWACLGGKDLDGDWSLVCEAAACDGLTADDLKGALIEKIDFFRNLPQVLRELGIDREVIDHAIDPQRALTPLAQLEAATCPKSGP